MIGISRNRAREHIRGQRDADRHIRLHAEKRDEHRTDDRGGAHSGETGAESRAHAGEKRDGDDRQQVHLLRLLQQRIHVAVDYLDGSEKDRLRTFVHSIEQMLEEGFLHGSPLLYDRLRERRAGKLDFAAVVLGGMPREIPLPHQTVYIDRNQIGLDMADFNDVARRAAAGVVRKEHQNVKRRLRQSQLLTQRLAYRMIRERSLLRKFQSAIHYTPPQIQF